MFNELEKIDGINTFKVDNYVSGNRDITIFDIPEGIPLSMFNELVEHILKNNEIPNFDNDRNIIEKIYSDYTLIEYDDKELRNKDRKIMNGRFNKINTLKSETIDGNKQIALPVGEFELNGKYYLIVSPYNPFTEETNPEIGVFKGIIVNPELYFGKVGKEVGDNKGKVEDIL